MGLGCRVGSGKVNIECRRVEILLTIYDLLITIFAVAGGLDDGEVKIADFAPSTAKPTTRQVFCWGKIRRRLPATQIELNACERYGYGVQKSTGRL